MGDRSTLIEKLGNENYFLWQVKMRMLLVKEKLWRYVDGVRVEPQNEEAAKKEQEALALILLNIGDDQFVVCRTAINGQRSVESIEKLSHAKHVCEQSTYPYKNLYHETPTRRKDG